ncbi:hypothetical protein HAX54_026048 [Datura stramonium]|uniref:Trichome birefringence-like N-terminal domain-containing protein n=1 Tax=Datura stramonium TaxID=4076 RepID=A0ABS8Y500_DATST|nr:hypothetical protein [Datura stramonium]
MNFQDLEISLGKLQTRKKNATKIAPFVALAILFTLIPIYYPSMHPKRLSQVLSSSSSSSLGPLPDNTLVHQSNISSSTTQEKIITSSPPPPQVNLTKSSRQVGINGTDEKCDLFSGEWVPNPEGPYYTNTTCFAIQEHQNCIKYGRPDRDFLKWKWKPDACELPIFEAHQFLELVRGKSLAFVGDSVARNHMQSLICLLSKVNFSSPISFLSFSNKFPYSIDHFFIGGEGVEAGWLIYYSVYLVRSNNFYIFNFF